MEFQTQNVEPEMAEDNKVMKNVKALKVGAGDGVMRVKFPEGLWLGAAAFSDSPFRVDFYGNLTSGGTIQGATIKNGSGVTLIDSTGLNSSNNFRADALSGTGPITTTSNSFVDVSGSSMTGFVLTRPAVVVISFSVYGYNSRYRDTDGQETSEMTAQLVDSVDGVVEAALLTGIPFVFLDSFLYPAAAEIYPSFYSSTNAFLLSAGTHVLKLQFRRENSSGTATIDAFGISYSVLGI